MKKLFLSALLLTSFETALASENGMNCLKTIKEFMSIADVEKSETMGVSTDNEKCSLVVDMKFNDADPTSSEALIYIDMDHFSRGASTQVLGGKNSLYDQNLKSCSVKNGVLTVDFSYKELYGWKRRFSGTVKLEKVNGSLSKAHIFRRHTTTGFSLKTIKKSETCLF